MAPPLRRWLHFAVFTLFLTAACDMGNDSGPSIPSDGNVPCTNKGNHCNSSTDCCGTLTCTTAKVCSDGGCVGPGSHCSTSGDCCGTALCSGGVCSGVCSSDGGHCTTSANCCGTSLCNSGVCQSGSCVGVGAHCLRSSDCCGGALCNASGVCQ